MCVSVPPLMQLYKSLLLHTLCAIYVVLWCGMVLWLQGTVPPFC